MAPIGAPRNCSAASCAWRRPRLVSRGWSDCPCARPRAFQVLSPCRTSQSTGPAYGPPSRSADAEGGIGLGAGRASRTMTGSVRPVCERRLKNRPPSGSLQDILSLASFPVRVRTHQVADAPPPACGGRLLVVDDDPDVRESLERALRYAGYSVTTAVHGADALDVLARSPVDLV